MYDYRFKESYFTRMQSNNEKDQNEMGKINKRPQSESTFQLKIIYSICSLFFFF